MIAHFNTPPNRFPFHHISGLQYQRALTDWQRMEKGCGEQGEGRESYSSFLSVFTGNTVSQTSSTPLIVNGVLGESVTLILKFPVEEKITSITWLHDGKSAVFIEPNEALNRVTDPKRKNRLNVTESYSLHLSNLTMADSGHYRAQITTLTSLLFTSYDLRIFSESNHGV